VSGFIYVLKSYALEHCSNFHKPFVTGVNNCAVFHCCLLLYRLCNVFNLVESIHGSTAPSGPWPSS
jgi:hypothetical protein